MEPTQVKPGSQPEHLPVPTGAAQPEAYRRAPTLMAGESPGAHGQVVVWSPDLAKMRRPMLALASLWALCGVVGSIILGPSYELFWFLYFICSAGAYLFIPFLYFYYRMLKRPGYVTTDGAGIGLTTWQSSQAIQWADIQSMDHLRSLVDPRLVIRASRTVTLDLVGYPAEAQKRLVALVAEQAKLVPDPRKPWRYVRPLPPLAAPPTATSLPNPSPSTEASPRQDPASRSEALQE